MSSEYFQNQPVYKELISRSPEISKRSKHKYKEYLSETMRTSEQKCMQLSIKIGELMNQNNNNCQTVLGKNNTCNQLNAELGIEQSRITIASMILSNLNLI